MFSTKTIDEVTETLIDYRGRTPPKSSGGIKLITAKVIKDGFVQDGNHEFISEEIYDSWMIRGLPQQWDILITTEAPLGQVAQLRTDEKVALAQRIILLRGNPSVIDQQYYFQALKSPFVQAGLKARATGTTVLGIKQSELRQVEIPYPPLPTQRKIAATLSAYDDLIENNTRRIALLEEMARRLYREWFVRFRFPGHESVRMVDSSLGMIPEGWEVKTIGEAVETLGGGTPSTKTPEYWDNGSIIWFIPSDLTSAGTMFISESSKKITELGFQKSSARLFPPYSVMMTSRATIGVVAINTQEACTNQGFITCIPNERVSVYQIYFWIEQNKDKIITVASGATYKEINRTEFRGFLIAVPDSNTNVRFVEMMTPIAKQIETLQARNISLRRTRDLLLPRLVSGALDVERLPITTGTVVFPQEGMTDNV